MPKIHSRTLPDGHRRYSFRVDVGRTGYVAADELDRPVHPRVVLRRVPPRQRPRAGAPDPAARGQAHD
jgi:hypothetical protein